jgi:AraC-like DNA-binding protein
MRVRPKITAAVAVGAVTALVAVGGTAIAASSSSSSSFLDDFARHLGVAPSKVQSALQQTEQDQINQLVKEGKLTKQQAQQLEQRLKQHAGGGQLPFGFPMFGHHGFGGHFGGHFGGPGGFGPGPIGGQFQAAASYLGVSTSTLMSDLRGGKTLATLATAHGKSVSGLEAAMLAAAEKNLQSAVSQGHLTEAQATKFEGFLRMQIDNFVQHGFRFPGRPGSTDRPSFWGNSAAPAAPPAAQS